MSPLKKLGIELILRVVEHNGGSFRSARFHARRLREAGFVGVQDHASAYGNGTRESAAELAPVMARQVEDADFVSIVEREQWVDHATLHDIAAEFRAWGESPDCYLACFKCAATGRRPHSTRMPVLWARSQHLAHASPIVCLTRRSVQPRPSYRGDSAPTALAGLIRVTPPSTHSN
jgi:hypothetical protein